MGNEAGVKRFEDLIAWQKARKLTMSIYEMTGNSRFSKDFGLRDQIRRAAVSVMSNIAEGFERVGKAEFNRFLVMAKASCAEVRSQLYVALDIGYIKQEQFNEIHNKADEVARIIGGLRKMINSTEY
jgi:four helix bundle protein